MGRPPPLFFKKASNRFLSTASRTSIIRIQKGTFYRRHPAFTSDSDLQELPNPPLFPKLTFTLPASVPQHWSIIGPSLSGKTTLLEILRGQHVCLPPQARSFPYITSDEVAKKDPRLRFPARAIQYVGFDGEGGGLGGKSTRGAYLGARYESRREETDFSLLDYLKGSTELNPDEALQGGSVNEQLLNSVIEDLDLGALLDMPAGNLSNGQTRRARIAKALLEQPEVLLLDEPFMGLDPLTTANLSSMLHRLAENMSPRIVMSLRPQDPIPDWITHLLCIGYDFKVSFQGTRDNVIRQIKDHFTTKGVKRKRLRSVPSIPDFDADILEVILPKASPLRKEGRTTRHEHKNVPHGEAIIEMKNVKVRYGNDVILGNWKEMGPDGSTVEGLCWTVKRGERWAIFGPNGSGKTTLLSLICSDHPQTYGLSIKLFGRSRLPSPGKPAISIFDLQRRIGQCSPEIHAFFPKHLTLRRTLESAWAETFLSKPTLDHHRDALVNISLRWFEKELNPNYTPNSPSDLTATTPIAGLHLPLTKPPSANLLHIGRLFDPTDAGVEWADNLIFRSLPFSSQRLALFIRALISSPDLIILDEAFGGMDTQLRDKCFCFLEYGFDKSLDKPENATQTWEGRLKLTATRKEMARVEREGGEKKFNGMTKDQTLIVVSHSPEETPRLVNSWMCLPQPQWMQNDGKEQERPRFGRIDDNMRFTASSRIWKTIWGL